MVKGISPSVGTCGWTGAACGAGEGFAVGDKLHAVVIDDGDIPEAAHPLNVEERFERAIYTTHRHNIVSVWSDGREVVRR